MGTSGAFGGSGSAAWSEVHDLFDAIQVPTGSSGATEPSAESFWTAVLPALTAGDPTFKAPRPSIPLSDLLPSRVRVGGSGGVASKAGPSPAKGRSRRASQQIGRGSAAIAAGLAFARGDNAGLREFGLTLKDLSGLSVRQRCQKIMDTVLGQPGHPDDEALRNAVQPTVIAAITGSISDPVELMRELLANYVMETVLVELSSQHASGLTSVAETERREQTATQWIRAKVETIKLDLSSNSPQDLVDLGLRMTQSLLKILGKAPR